MWVLTNDSILQDTQKMVYNTLKIVSLDRFLAIPDEVLSVEIQEFIAYFWKIWGTCNWIYNWNLNNDYLQFNEYNEFLSFYC